MKASFLFRSDVRVRHAGDASAVRSFDPGEAMNAEEQDDLDSRKRVSLSRDRAKRHPASRSYVPRTWMLHLRVLPCSVSPPNSIFSRHVDSGICSTGLEARCQAVKEQRDCNEQDQAALKSVRSK
jgi:hypothetical protein